MHAPSFLYNANPSPVMPSHDGAFAGVAQLVEQLTCNEKVEGSTPFTGTISASTAVSGSLGNPHQPRLCGFFGLHPDEAAIPWQPASRVAAHDERFARPDSD